MFRIYFQSGEFYGDQGISWVTLFKDFLIPLAGVGVPLLLFYLGIRQERRKAEKQGEEDRQKSKYLEDMRLLYFHSLFKEAFKHCSHFEDVLLALLDVVKTDSYHTANLSFDGDADLKRIVVDLDRENLFYAYRQNINDLSLNVIFKALDAAYGLQQTFSDAWEKANRDITDRKNKLRSTTADFGLKAFNVNAIDPSDVSLRDQLMQIFVAHAEKEHAEDRVYYELVDGLIIPFAAAIEISGKTKNPLWRELFNVAVDAQIIDKQVDSIAQQYLNVLEGLAQTLGRILPDLYKHYLPLEDYLVQNSLLAERFIEDEENQGEKM